jgi:hypothetical protein
MTSKEFMEIIGRNIGLMANQLISSLNHLRVKHNVNDDLNEKFSKRSKKSPPVVDLVKLEEDDKALIKKVKARRRKGDDD